MWPWLLRPPVPRLPTVRFLTGRPFHSSLRSTRTTPRRPGVIGLKDLSAMSVPSLPLDARGHVDLLASGQRHDGFLVVRALAAAAAEDLALAVHRDGVDRGDLDLEQ